MYAVSCALLPGSRPLSALDVLALETPLIWAGGGVIYKLSAWALASAVPVKCLPFKGHALVPLSRPPACPVGLPDLLAERRLP